MPDGDCVLEGVEETADIFGDFEYFPAGFARYCRLQAESAPYKKGNISLKGTRSWPIVIFVILARVHRHSASLESQSTNFDQIGQSGEPTACCCYTKPCNVNGMCHTVLPWLSLSAPQISERSERCNWRLYYLGGVEGLPKSSYRFRGGRLQERIGFILLTFLCLKTINTILCSLWFPGTGRG